MELAAARLADARKKDQEKAAPKAGDKAAGDSTQTPEKSKEAGGDKSKESSVEKAKQSRQQRTPQKQVGVFFLLARSYPLLCLRWVQITSRATRVMSVRLIRD